MALSQTHQQQLTASAINPAIIAERGYETLADMARLAQLDGHLANYQRRLPALAIPHYKLGQRYTLVIRPDQPREHRTDDGTTKPVKYEWGAGLPLIVDMLPRFRDALKDTAIDIWITEGAKKADALASLGVSLVPLNLNGVWGWSRKDADGRKQLLPEFNEIALKGRRVVLAFDSDSAVNSHVQQALEALVKELRKRGAIAGLLQMPHSEAQKLGVDDAISQGWSFEQLAAAVAWPEKGAKAPKEPKEPEPDLLDAAKLWAEHYGAEWAYDAGGRCWRRWIGTHWERLPDKAPELDAMAIEVLRAAGLRVTSGSRLDGCIRAATTETRRPFVEAPHLIAFTNGTLDTTSGALRPHERSDELTNCLPYAYAPGAYATISTFLAETIPEPAMRQAYIAHIGLALLGDRRLHKAALLIGPPRSGKSTLLGLANATCGNAHAANAGPELFDRETEGLRSRATWNGRRLVTLEELPAEALRNENLVKAMIAHGGVAQRRLNQHEDTDNQWTPKLLMATNEAPRYSDRSGALTERLIPIFCPNHRPEGHRNIHLLDALLAELPAFAPACIAAAQQTLAAGMYTTSDAMRAALAQIETTGDAVKSFAAERLIREPDAWVSTDGLYSAYKAYCTDNGNSPMAKERFTAALCERYRNLTPKRARENGVLKRGVAGIRFRESWEEDVTPVTAEEASCHASCHTDLPQQDAINDEGVTPVTSETVTLYIRAHAHTQEEQSHYEQWETGVTGVTGVTPLDALGLTDRVRVVGEERRQLAERYEALMGGPPRNPLTLEELRAAVAALEVDDSPT